jgi:nucleoside-diphosphate-sugar epimerase
MRTCLVTGGAGFIGSHLTDALLVHGWNVRVFDDFSTGRRPNLAGVSRDAEIVEGDLRDPSAVHRAAKGCEVVFHLGALGSVPRSVENPGLTHEVNVTGSVNVLTAARDAGARRVIIASSSSVYGDAPDAVKREEDLGNPLSPYAVSKRAMELYGQVFALRYGFEVVALRYFNVFGPRQDPDAAYTAVVPHFFRAALRGARPVIYGDGEQTRDFTFVADVVEASVRASAAPVPGGFLVSNVALGGRVTVNRLWGAIAGLTGAADHPEHRPPRPGDVLHASASTERLRGWLGWAPAISLEEGLDRSFASYRERMASQAT